MWGPESCGYSSPGESPESRSVQNMNTSREIYKHKAGKKLRDFQIIARRLFVNFRDTIEFIPLQGNRKLLLFRYIYNGTNIAYVIVGDLTTILNMESTRRVL